MEFPQVIALIGAIGGGITALSLIVAPISVAMINRRADKKPAPEVPQGQTVDPATDLMKVAINVERDRRRHAERTLGAYRTALALANDRLADAGLDLVHPEL